MCVCVCVSLIFISVYKCLPVFLPLLYLFLYSFSLCLSLFLPILFSCSVSLYFSQFYPLTLSPLYLSILSSHSISLHFLPFFPLTLFPSISSHSFLSLYFPISSHSFLLLYLPLHLSILSSYSISLYILPFFCSLGLMLKSSLFPFSFQKMVTQYCCCSFMKIVFFTLKDKLFKLNLVSNFVSVSPI